MERPCTCTGCGVLVQIPTGQQTERCPRCYNFVVLSNSNDYANSYYPPGSNHYPPEKNHYPANNNDYVYGPHPQPQLPPQLIPHGRGRRRAVLIGINYCGQYRSLRSSVNDVRLMRQLLVTWLGFPYESVLVLTEEEMDPYKIPTKRNIRAALSWLVQGCQPGESLMLYYSGFGSQVVDEDGDEPDGYDEALCPLDYQNEGKILDDEINATIVRPLPYGVTLHAIIDAGNSGTLLDLPFVCKMNNQGYVAWQDHRVSAAYKGTSGGTAICISGFEDNNSRGASAIAPDGSVASMMTYCFVQALQRERGLTYGSLIRSMCNYEALQRRRRPYGPPTSQVPQMSSTEKFEIYGTPFQL